MSTEGTDLVRAEDDFETSYDRREREREERTAACMLDVNRKLQTEHWERESARLTEAQNREHEQIIERARIDREARIAMRDADLRRCLWIDTLTNASDLPVEDALARADRFASEYGSRFA